DGGAAPEALREGGGGREREAQQKYPGDEAAAVHGSFVSFGDRECASRSALQQEPDRGTGAGDVDRLAVDDARDEAELARGREGRPLEKLLRGLDDDDVPGLAGTAHGVLHDDVPF